MHIIFIVISLSNSLPLGQKVGKRINNIRQMLAMLLNMILEGRPVSRQQIGVSWTVWVYALSLRSLQHAAKSLKKSQIFLLEILLLGCFLCLCIF